jgi:hypothetical protein
LLCIFNKPLKVTIKPNHPLLGAGGREPVS